MKNHPSHVNNAISEDLVRSELRKLPEKIKEALVLRFWHLETIESISRHIGKSWDETDSLINEGLKMMKQGPMNSYIMDLQQRGA